MKNPLNLSEKAIALATDTLVVRKTSAAYKRGEAMKKILKQALATVEIASQEYQTTLEFEFVAAHESILILKTASITK